MTRFGTLRARQFDPSSQVLAKLERGFDQDIGYVTQMVARGLVEPT